MTNILSLQRAGLVSFAALALGAAACTSDLPIDGSGGGGSQTTSSQSSAGGGCPDFADEASLGAVTFTVHNKRAASIYISKGTCGDQLLLAETQGADVHRGAIDAGELTCATVGTKGVAPDCLDGTLVEVKGGATMDLAWSGHFYVSQTLPAECANPPLGEFVFCSQAKAFPASAAAEVKVYAFDTASCVGLDCMQSGGGVFIAKKTFKYPDEAQVDLDVD